MYVRVYVSMCMYTWNGIYYVYACVYVCMRDLNLRDRSDHIQWVSALA